MRFTYRTKTGTLLTDSGLNAAKFLHIVTGFAVEKHCNMCRIYHSSSAQGVNNMTLSCIYSPRTVFMNRILTGGCVVTCEYQHRYQYCSWLIYKRNKYQLVCFTTECQWIGLQRLINITPEPKFSCQRLHNGIYDSYHQ